MATDYSYLREEYPEIISQDQLYKICRISRRKATWLLENGYIPCKDSGKRTRRFKIRIDDVIIYLTQLEKSLESLRTPPGIFSSGIKYRPIKQILEPIDPKGFTKMLKKKWSDFPDALTISDVMELIGCSQSTIPDWIMQEKIFRIRYYNRYLIPKDSLIKYLAGDGHNNIQQKSKKHKDLIQQYKEELSAAYLTRKSKLSCGRIIETILRRNTLNTRARDVYDIFILRTTQTYDASLLKEAISATAAHRNTADQIADIKPLLQMIEDSLELRKLWEKYRREFDYATDISYEQVISALRDVCAVLQ